MKTVPSAPPPPTRATPVSTPAAPITPPSSPPANASRAGVEPPPAPSPAGHPLRTRWQRRWLGLDATHPRLQALADACERLCARWHARAEAPNRLLVVVGNPGCGKTHCARGVFHWARHAAFSAWEQGRWDRVPDALYAHWPAVCDDCKNGLFGALEDLGRATLLIVDDAGAEHDPSKMAAAKLCQLLTRRERLWTLLTTNIQPAAWEERFDARVADRLLRHSMLCDLTPVPSYAATAGATHNGVRS
jgi:hypothetical protein